MMMTEIDRDYLARVLDTADDPDIDSYVEEWIATGLSERQIVDAAKARCFDPAVAASLYAAGVTAEQMAIRTPENVGNGSYIDTIAYKVGNGDLSVAEALAEIEGGTNN